MSSFGQLIAGAGRVGQGMDAARERSQILEQSELRLMEMRRAEEAARRSEEARRQAAALGPAVSPTFGGLNVPQMGRMPMQQVAAQPQQAQPQQAQLQQAQPQQVQAQQPAMLQQGQIPSRGVAPFSAGEIDLTQYTTTPDLDALQQDTYTASAQNIPIGEITREQFDALPQQLQQEYLDTANARRALGRTATLYATPLSMVATPLTMAASGAARAGEYVAESPFGRVLGLTAPGEDVDLGMRDPFAAGTALTEAYNANMPLSLEEFRASLPTGTAQPAPTQPAPTQPAPIETTEQAAPVEDEVPPPQPVAAGVNVGRDDPIETVATNPPTSFTADPNKFTPYLDQGLRNREYLFNLAQIYRQQGFPDQAFTIETQIQQLDNNLYKLELDQSMSEFRLGGDPTRAVGLVQMFTGVPVNIQPRSDGLYNLFVNDEVIEEGVTVSDITDTINTYTDEQYRANKVRLQTENAKEAYKQRLEVAKEQAKQNAQMIREAVLAKINGQYSLAEAQLDNAGFVVTNMGDGTALLTSKDGGVVATVNTLTETMEVDGIEVPLAPTAQLVEFPGMR